MEIRDLYDENRNLTEETIYKNEKVPDNRYILVVAVWIQNSKGELLMQQRSFTKNSYAGKWATTGGHPKSGESSVQGMITEIKEELGIDVTENELKMIETFKEDGVFVDVYYLNKDYDIKDMVLQEEEVETVKWMTIEEVEQLIKNDELAKSHIELYELTKHYFKK